MACPHCGSWSVRADRSLAGRLVCGRCGRPLQGVRAARRGSGRSPLPWRGGVRRTWQWALLALLASAAALAALQPFAAPPAADGGAGWSLRR